MFETLFEHVNIQPRLICVCSETCLNLTVILLLQSGRRTAPLSRGGVCVPRPKLPSEGRWKISPSTTETPPATRSQSCECVSCTPVRRRWEQRSEGVCPHMFFRVTLRSNDAEVCLDPEAPMGRQLIRCWKRWGNEPFNWGWSTPCSLNQFWSVFPFPKSSTSVFLCVCVCVSQSS